MNNSQDLPMQLLLFLCVAIFITWVFDDEIKPPKLNP